jgi:MATE family multidrug resistance protein
MCVLYLLFPQWFYLIFRNTRDPMEPAVAAMVPTLLQFVSLYMLCDTLNIAFSFALRGAGDTRFVSIIVVVLAWPIMVIPTWAAFHYDWGLYWAWGFASAYIMVLGFVFLGRFKGGKWRSMRVIEQPAIDAGDDVETSGINETAAVSAR